MTKITHVKMTHYIDDTKKNVNKSSNARSTFMRFQLNTTVGPSATIGAQGAKMSI